MDHKRTRTTTTDKQKKEGKKQTKQNPKGHSMSQHHNSIHTDLQRIRGEETGGVGTGGSWQLPTDWREKGRERDGGRERVTYQLWYYVGAQKCYILFAINKCQRIHNATM